MLIPLSLSFIASTAEIKPWMFQETVNGSTMANQTSSSYPSNYNNQSGITLSGSLANGTTNNPLLNSTSSSSTESPVPSIYSNTVRISNNNKKQSKNGGGGEYAVGMGGFPDQNAIRRGFTGNGEANGGGRNKEGRGKNNRKQISNGGGGQNSDEGPAEWNVSSDRDSANYTEPKYYLGKLIQGTYCSRVFSDCEKRACRMQSPNYPGTYPRNLTCFYAVRQVRERENGDTLQDICK